jgi:hypothetical protein
MIDGMTDSLARTTWNAAEAADFAGVSRRTIERRIAAKKLQATKDPDTQQWQITPAAMAEAGFVLRTAADKPPSVPAAEQPSTLSEARDQEMVEENRRLRAEIESLRRRAEVAEAIAAERGNNIDGLREAFSTIKALPAGEPPATRRVGLLGRLVG